MGRPPPSALTLDLRRRITWLMVLRVVLVTVVMGSVIVLNLAAPRELGAPGSVALFTILAVTYALSILYAVLLPRVADPRRFADAQVIGDLLLTTGIVHFTGGAQSAYTFLYPMSIVGAASVRQELGAALSTLVACLLYGGVSLLGWARLLPVPAETQVLPWDLTPVALVRNLVLNVGAFTAIGALAAGLGRQVARAGERLETQIARTGDLTALNQDIIRCLSSGLVTIDPEGVVLTFNEAAEEILEMPAGNAVGRPLSWVLPEVSRVATETPAGESRRRVEVTVPGGRTLGVSVSPLTDHRDQPIGQILNFQDLSQLREMEKKVKLSERLAAVGSLAAGVAHELRNPLASISGSIELLKNVRGLESEDRTLMDIVIREVDRLNGLVSELVDYARPREPMALKTDLGALLDETVRVFRQDRSKAGVTVVWSKPAVEVEVSLDPDQIRQVVWNLLRNAAEALTEGGEIRLEIARGDEGVEVSVADTGTGIAAADLERIFEPFFTTKTRGTGLGLALVHRIITEHGGTLNVTSEVGKGTRVSFLLGRGQAPPAKA